MSDGCTDAKREQEYHERTAKFKGATIQEPVLVKQYNGEVYKVLGVGTDAETSKKVVIYQSLLSDELFVKDYDSFEEELPFYERTFKQRYVFEIIKENKLKGALYDNGF